MVLASVRAGKHTAMVKYTGPMLGVERESQQEAKLISKLFIADNASNLKMHSKTEYVYSLSTCLPTVFVNHD